MKMRQSFVLLMAFVCIAFSFNACKKGGSDNKPTEQSGKIPGMGNNGGAPAGDQYVLPAGITLIGALKGDYCDTTYIVGSGEFVAVCAALFNNGTTDVTITLPAGLIFLATDAADQHGMVIQETRILLKAKKITRVGIGAYCLNASKHASSSTSTYTLGPVSSSPLMRELIGKLGNKKVNRNEYPNEDAYQEAEDNIQGLIWSATDGAGYTNYDLWKMWLDKIPNK